MKNTERCKECSCFTEEGRKSLAEANRRNPIYGTNFSKPLSSLVENIRQQMALIRGKLSDISYAFPGWGEQIKEVEGLLTCGLISLEYIKEQMMNIELNHRKRKTMSYRIIRLSEDYGMAIIVSPENAEAWAPGNKYLLLNDNIPECANTFKEVSERTARRYFGGIADGMGFSEIPDTVFEEIADVEKWVLKRKIEFYASRGQASDEEIAWLRENFGSTKKGETK